MIGWFYQDPAGGSKAAGAGVDERVRDLNKINNDHRTSSNSLTTTDNYYIPYSGSQTKTESDDSWNQQRAGPISQHRQSEVTQATKEVVNIAHTNSSATAVCNGVPPPLSAHNAITNNSSKPSLHMENAGQAVGRPKPPDYDDAWYEEADGQFYNQYDWYQDENGEWQYDYRLEEQGLVQNEEGEWVSVSDKVPVVDSGSDKDRKNDSSNRLQAKDERQTGTTNVGVSSISGNNKNAQEHSGPRPKPPDYDDAWYEEADGQFYNQYDWYQDENGEWQYDYRLEEQGLVQNEFGEWVTEEELTQKKKLKEVSQVEKKDKQEPKVPSPTDKAKPDPGPSEIPKPSSASMFKGLSSFGSGLVGAATSVAKEAASNAALAVDSISDVADAAMEAMPDVELPQVTLPAKSASSVATTVSAFAKGAEGIDSRSTSEKTTKKEPIVQQRSSDGFSQVFSSSSVSTNKEQSASLSKHKTSLPPRPADYDDFWYQADNGNWYNEYDDMGYEFADEEILVVEEQEAVITPPAEVKSKLSEVQQQKTLSSKSSQEQDKAAKSDITEVKQVVKQQRPEDYDDFWYQDDDGQWKNEYDDLGYNFEDDEEEEEFYTEEELAKEESKLFQEKVNDQKQATLSKIDETEMYPEKNAKLKQDDEKNVSSSTASGTEKNMCRPLDYEDHWFQDYDGNWYNEYDQVEEEKTSGTVEPPNANSTSSRETPKKEKKTVSFDKEDVEQQHHQPASAMGCRPMCRNPKDRWQWAFTRIIQVGVS
jgi:hypothetical protein